MWKSSCRPWMTTLGRGRPAASYRVEQGCVMQQASYRRRAAQSMSRRAQRWMGRPAATSLGGRVLYRGLVLLRSVSTESDGDGDGDGDRASGHGVWLASRLELAKARITGGQLGGRRW